MSVLRTNKIYPRDGLPAGASGGGIIQMVQASTSTQVSLTTTTFQDTGLSASITPTSASNKILVLINQQYYMSSNGYYQYMGLRIYRDSNIIHAPIQDGTGPFDYGVQVQVAAGNPNYIQVGTRAVYQILDSPATTSAVTYKTQGRPYITSGSGSVIYQASSSTQNGTSYITLMEVSG